MGESIKFNNDEIVIIEKIREEAQSIISKTYDVLSDCYDLYTNATYEFKDNLIALCKKKNVNINSVNDMHKYDKAMARLIIAYVFDGIDVKTRSKYASVIEHAKKKDISTTLFVQWYKDKGGLNGILNPKIEKDSFEVIQYGLLNNYVEPFNTYETTNAKGHLGWNVEIVYRTPTTTEVHYVNALESTCGKQMLSAYWSNYERADKAKVKEDYLQSASKSKVA
tara:strand:+ start:836 stop:1504 length:669 start_codon:yes stop_codon:yes gene_type:complete